MQSKKIVISPRRGSSDPAKAYLEGQLYILDIYKKTIEKNLISYKELLAQVEDRIKNTNTLLRNSKQMQESMHDSKKKRVCVLAGSYVEFCHFCTKIKAENYKQDVEFIYAGRPDDLRGIFFDEMVVIGTFPERHDATVLYDEATRRIKKP